MIFFTCLGCFLVLNDSTVQTVTLSSEGPASETDPHSMGEYQLAEKDKEDSLIDYSWYQHKDRENRFLICNNFGNIE